MRSLSERKTVFIALFSFPMLLLRLHLRVTLFLPLKGDFL